MFTSWCCLTGWLPAFVSSTWLYQIQFAKFLQKGVVPSQFSLCNQRPSAMWDLHARHVLALKVRSNSFWLYIKIFNGSAIPLGSWFVTTWICSLNLKLNSCKLSHFCWYLCIGWVAASVTIGTKENCCHKTALTWFQLISGSKDSKNIITATCAFPRASFFRFCFVTATIFSNLKIQSKYNLGLASKVGLSSINESQASSICDIE